MKKVSLILGFLFSASLFANTMLSIETKYEAGKALITATNLSGEDLICEYKVNWRTSLTDLHMSWGQTHIPADEALTVVIEDSRGLPVKKATPHFECSID